MPVKPQLAVETLADQVIVQLPYRRLVDDDTVRLAASQLQALADATDQPIAGRPLS